MVFFMVKLTTIIFLLYRTLYWQALAVATSILVYCYSLTHICSFLYQMWEYSALKLNILLSLNVRETQKCCLCSIRVWRQSKRKETKMSIWRPMLLQWVWVKRAILQHRRGATNKSSNIFFFSIHCTFNLATLFLLSLIFLVVWIDLLCLITTLTLPDCAHVFIPELLKHIKLIKCWAKKK